MRKNISFPAACSSVTDKHIQEDIFLDRNYENQLLETSGIKILGIV
jgi:hypothetical protein